MADMTFGEFARRVLGFERALTDPELEKIATRMGKAAQRIATDAVAADLGGDDKFSGWAKAPLKTTFTYIGDGKVSFKPTRQSAGPWTVAEVGRNKGNASGFSGPGIGKDGTTARTKSGKLRKVRARKSKRWNGYTQGKGTASDALREIDRRMPGVVEPEIAKAVREFFD